MDKEKIWDEFYSWSAGHLSRLSSLYESMIQIDPSFLNDEFRFYIEREIDLNLIDNESKIELLADFLETKGYDKDLLNDLVMDIDKSYYKEIERIDNIYSTNDDIINYLQYFVDKMSAGELENMLEALEFNLDAREINFYTFVKASVVCLARLKQFDTYECVKFSAAGRRYYTKEKTGYLEEYNRIIEVWKKLESERDQIELDETHGYTFDIEEAIDAKREVERIAKKCGITIESAAECCGF